MPLRFDVRRGDDAAGADVFEYVFFLGGADPRDISDAHGIGLMGDEVGKEVGGDVGVIDFLLHPPSFYGLRTLTFSVLSEGTSEGNSHLDISASNLSFHLRVNFIALRCCSEILLGASGRGRWIIHSGRSDGSKSLGIMTSKCC